MEHNPPETMCQLGDVTKMMCFQRLAATLQHSALHDGTHMHKYAHQSVAQQGGGSYQQAVRRGLPARPVGGAPPRPAEGHLVVATAGRSASVPAGRRAVTSVARSAGHSASALDEKPPAPREKRKRPEHRFHSRVHRRLTKKQPLEGRLPDRIYHSGFASVFFDKQGTQQEGG